MSGVAVFVRVRGMRVLVSREDAWVGEGAVEEGGDGYVEDVGENYWEGGGDVVPEVRRREGEEERRGESGEHGM